MFIERNAISSSTPFGGAELNETIYSSRSFRSSERSLECLDWQSINISPLRGEASPEINSVASRFHRHSLTEAVRTGRPRSQR